MNLLHTVRFNLNDLLQLKRMKKLKHLCYDMDDWLKQQLPNIRIHFKPGNQRIAIPCQPEYNSYNKGFWEIKADQEELFSIHRGNN